MSLNKKVLFSVGSLNVGGAETQLTLLIEGLISRGWQCDVFVLQQEGPLVERLQQAGAGIHTPGFKTGRGPLIFVEILKSIFMACMLIRKNRYRVVHGYLPLANFIIASAAYICRVPQIYTSKRALGTHQDRHPMWRRFDNIANRLSSKIVANSQGVKDDVISRESVAGENIELIYNGLNFDQIEIGQSLRSKYRDELALTEGDIAVIVVANLIPYKGHEDVIRAASLLSGSKNHIVFLFAGEDRGIQSNLEALAADLAVTNYRFLGRRSDIPLLLSAADIGLVSSHEEGFCNALLEQMGAGLPVVATRVGGNAEALAGGQLGVLIDSQSPGQMAEALNSLASDSGLRENLGVLARANVKENYSVAAMVESHEHLYVDGMNS